MNCHECLKFTVVILLMGCQPLLEKKSSQPSESTGCDSSEHVKPPPGIPNYFKKDKVRQHSFKFEKKIHFTQMKNQYLKGDEFVTLFDQTCLMANDKNRNKARNQIWEEILKYESHQLLKKNPYNMKRLPLKAYLWKLNKNYLRDHIEDIASQESCIVYMSENVRFDLYMTPNDPLISDQSYLNLIDAFLAWDIFFDLTTGINQDVTIAIIDSGVDIDHEDLINRLWTNSGEIPGNSSDDDGNGYVDDINGYNFASLTGNPRPEPWPAPYTGAEGHGTHVAGLAAAQYNNSKGMSGVMGQNIKIMSLNVFGASPGASFQDVMNAIIYAINQGVDVINMSLGARGSVTGLQSLMGNAIAEGVTLVVAAGNSSEELTSNNFYSPASYGANLEGLITVGSMDVYTNRMSEFSNYSSHYVEIMAPGSHLLDGGLLSIFPSNDYTHLQGTSMAAPVVAGAASLVVGYLKSKGYNYTPELVENLIINSAKHDLSYGGLSKNSKRLDLYNLAKNLRCYQ